LFRGRCQKLGANISILAAALLVCSSAIASGPPARTVDKLVCDVAADIALEAQDYPTAIDLHRKLLRLEKNNALAHYHLGFASVMRRRLHFILLLTSKRDPVRVCGRILRGHPRPRTEQSVRMRSTAQELARLETPLCAAKTENPCFGVCGKARLLPYAKAGGDMRSKNKWV